MSKAPRPVGQTTAADARPSRTLPWFRLYSEFATDPNIQSISFEDQRHFIVLMCLKGSGVLDREYPSAARKNAVVARGMGLEIEVAAEVHERLRDAGLIVGDWEPKGWANRQFESDHARERQAKHLAKLKAERAAKKAVGAK